jgi:hypothetical protein
MQWNQKNVEELAGKVKSANAAAVLGASKRNLAATYTHRVRLQRTRATRPIEPLREPRSEGVAAVH